MATRMNRRQREILKMVQQQGFVSIEALAHGFNVTPQTARRDINELCDQQLLTRYHGGAGISSTVENIAYVTRQVLYLQEKQLIAGMAAARIPDRASLFIGLGTTAEEVSKALVHRDGLRVITNNLNVAAVLSSNSSCEIIVTGGLVRNRDLGLTGEATVDFIRQFRVDIGVIGVSGIDVDGTLLEFDYREVRVMQAIIEHSRKVYLVADYSKFGRNAMVRLGSLGQVDALFTDRLPPRSVIDVMEEEKTELIISENGG